MKILFLLDDFPPVKITSASNLAYNLAKGLIAKNHEVFVITSAQDKQYEGELLMDGIKVYRIFSNYNLRWRAWLSLYNPSVLSEIKKIIRQINPDVCHFHHIHSYLSYYSFKIAKRYSKAIFLTAHDVMLFHYGKLLEFIDKNNLIVPKEFDYRVSARQQLNRFSKGYNPFRNIIIKHYLKCVDKVFAVSGALKDALNQNKIENVAVLYNGINYKDWQNINDNQIDDFKKEYGLIDKKVVFFGGRLSGHKGGEQILEAMKIVAGDINNAVLLVAGEKNDYALKMIKMAGDSAIGLVFTGWLAGDKLKTAFFASDVVVVPSISFDSFPLTNMEAMAAKKPVVGTCFGGTKEIIADGKNGFVINPYDIKTLAEKIIWLLKNPAEAKAFGENGFEMIVKNFSFEKQLAETLSWYKKFISVD